MDSVFFILHMQDHDLMILVPLLSLYQVIYITILEVTVTAGFLPLQIITLPFQKQIAKDYHS